MEIPNRDQREAELLALLLAIFEELQADIVADRIIPWDAYRQRIQQRLTQELAAVFVLAALIWTQDQPVFGLDDRTLATSAIGWALSKAATVVDRFITRAQLAVANLRGLFLYGAEKAAAAETIAGRSAADAIAVTEVTAAQTAGQRHAVQIYQATTGLVLAGVWVTEKDARVCPICQPLHGTVQPVWSARFPLGPPAHPRCRCTLTYQ